MKKHQNKKKFLTIGLLAVAIFLSSVLLPNFFSPARAVVSDEVVDDYALYQKYVLYLKYEKKQQYQGYKLFKKYKKYGYKNETARANDQVLHDYYQLFQSDPVTYDAYKKYNKQYKKYENYLNHYLPYAQYAPYKSYKQYNKKKFDEGAAYGGQEYLDGYNRYLAAQGSTNIAMGEADLGGGIVGPEISVGLTEYSKSNLQDSAFKITAFSSTTGNPLNYAIKNGAGTILATIAGATATKVKYLSNKNFTIYDSVPSPLTVASEIVFEAADPASAMDIVFDFNRPSSDYDQYRDKITLRYYDNSGGTDTIWAINKLPLEHYTWGMGEITGTGPIEHSKTMATIFRTYGYWKLKFSTKYALQGFKVNATPGNQLYYGYQWEIGHPNIRTAAEATRGKLVMYSASAGRNEIALTPYSSWTDGRTRSFAERWGSTDYPWCQSVKDPYGKSSMKTEDLEAAGNHMVGLSAHGSLSLAGSKYNWTWDRILQYYFTGINLLQAY